MKNFNNDWRLSNQDYLLKKELIQIPFMPYKEGWEHDHCAFCSVKIDQTTTDAYCTVDRYHWICKDCFQDFKDLFGWNVID